MCHSLSNWWCKSEQSDTNNHQVSLIIKFGASAFHTAVRWQKLCEMDSVFTLHNFIVLAIRMPKIIKVGRNLTKLWQKKLWLFLLRHGVLPSLLFAYDFLILLQLFRVILIFILKVSVVARLVTRRVILLFSNKQQKIWANTHDTRERIWQFSPSISSQFTFLQPKIAKNQG